MNGEERESLVLDPEGFLGPPDRVLAREHQLSEIRSSNHGPLAKSRPIHIWIHGPSGSGKTVCLRHILETDVADAGTLPIYIDCRQRFTALDMIEQVLGAGETIIEPRRSRDVQMALLRSTLGGRRCVIGLDDIDALHRSAIEDVLHHLLALPHATLICTSSSRQALLDLPESIRSRMVPRQVHFPPYIHNEILAVLQMYVRRVLRKGAAPEEVLRQICILANGDARRGLGILRHAVQRADSVHAPSLDAEHLVPGNYDHFDRRVEDELACLSSHHRILYDLVVASSSIPSVQLAADYRATCARQRLEPVATRTLNKYLSVLCLWRIVHRERGAGTSGWIYSIPGTVRPA